MPLHLRATTTSSSTTVTSSTAPEIPGMRLTSPSAAIVSPQSAICAKPMPNAKSTPRAHCGPPGFIEMLGQSIAQCLAESEKLETPDVNTADFSYMRKYAQAEAGILFQGSEGTQTEGSKSCPKARGLCLFQTRRN